MSSIHYVVNSMNTYLLAILASVVFITSACSSSQDTPDATGTFEAVETIVAAETNGKLLDFNVDEGQTLQAGQVVGHIDSTQPHLQMLHLLQNKRTILTGKPATHIQIKALQEQLSSAIADRERVATLVRGGVATQRQLDDANARVATLQAQILAQESTLTTNSATLDEQGVGVDIQLQEVLDRLRKCTITNPVSGTVLSTYAEPHEMAVIGKPLYRIADLTTLTLRAYVSGDQLANLKLGSTLTVSVDDGSGGLRPYQGTLSWVSEKAEFTPKSIQTKNERANLVYAIKVRVKNDGRLKLGMYGELDL